MGRDADTSTRAAGTGRAPGRTNRPRRSPAASTRSRSARCQSPAPARTARRRRARLTTGRGSSRTSGSRKSARRWRVSEGRSIGWSWRKTISEPLALRLDGGRRLDLQPVSCPSRSVGTALPLRHDALQMQGNGLGEKTTPPQFPSAAAAGYALWTALARPAGACAVRAARRRVHAAIKQDVERDKRGAAA